MVQVGIVQPPCKQNGRKTNHDRGGSDGDRADVAPTNKERNGSDGNPASTASDDQPRAEMVQEGAQSGVGRGTREVLWRHHETPQLPAVRNEA